MKRLMLPALLALTAAGCSQSSVVVPSTREESAKCELVQTLMRERVPQQLLASMADGQGTPSQVVVYVRRPDEAVLERLFVGDPLCAGPLYKVVQTSTREAMVLFLQPKGSGYVYAALRAGPDDLPVGGGEARGSVTKGDDGGWVASDVL